MRRERTPGYLATLDDDDRREALERVPAETRELAAALVYCALRPDAPWQKHIFDWQPFVISGLEWGLFTPGAKSLDAVEWTIDRRPTSKDLDDRLLWAADYINDERWAVETAGELGIESMQLAHFGFNASYPVRLAVAGVNNPLDDPRLVVAARQALAYRHADGITVEAGRVRLSLKLGDRAAALTAGGAIFSNHPVGMQELRRAEASGGGWRDLLGAARVGAAA